MRNDHFQSRQGLPTCIICANLRRNTLVAYTNRGSMQTAFCPLCSQSWNRTARPLRSVKACVRNKRYMHNRGQCQALRQRTASHAALQHSPCTIESLRWTIAHRNRSSRNAGMAKHALQAVPEAVMKLVSLQSTGNICRRTRPAHNKI